MPQLEQVQDPAPATQTLRVMIVRCESADQRGWLTLREALWPDCSRAEHLLDMASFIANPQRYVQFVAYADSMEAVGFCEAAVRTDYVNGTETSPVAFLEGIFVVPKARRAGIAASLVSAVARWAAAADCRELASDAALENHAGHAFHLALGFQESERVVFFRRVL